MPTPIVTHLAAAAARAAAAKAAGGANKASRRLAAGGPETSGGSPDRRSAGRGRGGSGPRPLVWLAAAVGGLLVVVFVLGGALMASIFGALGGGAATFFDDEQGCIAARTGLSGASNIDDIPQVALEAYNAAATGTGVPWSVLAAIGKVESNHGRFRGSAPRDNGDVVPYIIGIALDGSRGTRAILDTDGGRFDRDPLFDRAVGPMQFIPSTWATAGRDGNFDGVLDPHNLYDAALAAAHYLKRGGAPGRMREALFSYNSAEWYVTKVLDQAAAYEALAASGGTRPVDAPADTQVDTVPAPIAPDAPSVGGTVGDVTGGGGSDTVGATATGWSLPLAEGSYRLTARFGQPGAAWSSGRHTGLDFAAPTGTPVVAIADGRVRVRTDAAWAGPWLIVIEHGTVEGREVTSSYAHMSAITVSDGDVVAAGQQIGAVGSLGNSSGPHLHLEVAVDGTQVDPLAWLEGAVSPAVFAGGVSCSVSSLASTGSGSGAWGGYQNGRIPDSALATVPWAPHKFHPEAAAALTLLNDEYRKHFGTNIVITDGYRSYEGQVACQQAKGDLCAVPGTSNHGWGLAADLGGGIERFGTPQHNWMFRNAPRFGWIHPTWARQGGSKPEPWHWEFGEISTGAT